MSGLFCDLDCSSSNCSHDNTLKNWNFVLCCIVAIGQLFLICKSPSCDLVNKMVTSYIVPNLDTAVPILDAVVPILDAAVPILDEAVPIQDEAVPILDAEVLILDAAPSKCAVSEAVKQLARAVTYCIPGFMY